MLEAYTFTAARRSELQEQTDAWEASLLEQHYENLVKQAGLTILRDALMKQSQSGEEVSPRKDIYSRRALIRITSCYSRNRCLVFLEPTHELLRRL